MKIIMEVDIPDEDVTMATENAPGPGGDLAEWLVNFFETNDRSYLRDLGMGGLTVTVVEVK